MSEEVFNIKCINLYDCYYEHVTCHLEHVSLTQDSLWEFSTNWMTVSFFPYAQLYTELKEATFMLHGNLWWSVFILHA